MKNKYFIPFFVLIFFISSLYGIDRRRDQYDFKPGYFFIPAPYSLPGIGEGIAFVGMASNVLDTQTDLMADYITGDVKGYGIGFQDLYLVEKRFKLDLFHEGIDSATIQSYSFRGMNSDKEDYIYVTAEDLKFTGLRATASYFEKRLEFYLMYYTNEYNISAIKDKDEVLIANTSDADTQDFDTYTTGFMLDFTDDRVDPRKGLRYDYSLDYASDTGANAADYYISNHNLTAYIPIGKQSTWAFNYFKSDAHIISSGATDFDTIESSLGLDCDTLSGSDKTYCENLVNTNIDANKYGSAASLGGRTRLRSYPEGRFIGAHTQFYGTEFRWNITEENTPFNIWFMKDIRTSIQTAFFYEKGSVADNTDDLGKNEKKSYGLGLRLVTGSGLVYRLDAAAGDEDFNYTVIINYPWEIF